MVKRRIDKISPLHATRMGPAIRHATAKLEKQDAKTKILFLISDGRPQDRGYSREGVEKEYAVHDTHMALVEAKRLDITPFCLTVDKSGHDYLKAMCGDMSYEVLEDIWTLPHGCPSCTASSQSSSPPNFPLRCPRGCGDPSLFPRLSLLRPLSLFPRPRKGGSGTALPSNIMPLRPFLP